MTVAAAGAAAVTPFPSGAFSQHGRRQHYLLLLETPLDEPPAAAEAPPGCRRQAGVAAAPRPRGPPYSGGRTRGSKPVTNCSAGTARQMRSRACSKSAQMSSMSSTPVEKRIRLSLMPSFLRISGPCSSHGEAVKTGSIIDITAMLQSFTVPPLSGLPFVSADALKLRLCRKPCCIGRTIKWGDSQSCSLHFGSAGHRFGANLVPVGHDGGLLDEALAATQRRRDVGQFNGIHQLGRAPHVAVHLIRIQRSYR